jgi:hypothetical protein
MNTTILPTNRFPLVAATVVAAIVIVAFARTYYIKFLFDSPPLTVLQHVHGLIATVWIGLHVAQARLIAVRNVALHRRLGVFTAFVGVALVAEVLWMAIESARLGHGPPGRDPLQFLSVPVGTSTMFASFLALGLLLRKRREAHKRLMLLTTLTVLVPAAARLEVLPLLNALPRGILTLSLTAAALAWATVNDWRTRGRVHPAYVIGGIALLISMPLRRWIGFQDFWMPVARWLVG